MWKLPKVKTDVTGCAIEILEKLSPTIDSLKQIPGLSDIVHEVANGVQKPENV